MTDDELIEFTKSFREGILEGKSSDFMCAMVCYPLAGLLHFYGIDCECEHGETPERNHVWIRLRDGRVLDPTADQFGYSAVYLGVDMDIHAPA